MNQEPSLRARATDNTLLPVPTTQGDLPNNTLFDELISRYQKLVSRTEDMIVQQMCGEVESALKVHFSMTTSSVASFSSCAAI
jgi:RAD50-interacting protein 1